MAYNVKKIQKEINEILQAIADDESDLMICDSYEDYSKLMLDFIKSKNKKWFDMLFTVISEELDNGMDEDGIKKELQLKRLCKQLVQHIIDMIFDTDEKKIIIESDNESDVSDDNKSVDDTDDESENESADESENESADESDDDTVNEADNADNVVDINVPLDEAVNNFKWRENQKIAIKNIIDQNFKSGVFNEIMGAGKTYIIFNTISKHYEMYPNKGLYVIACFRQEILKDMIFDSDGEIDVIKKEKLKTYNIIDLDKFNIIDRVHHKKKILKLSKTKPSILFVNTDYLKLMRLVYDDINFVILDECHSVSADGLYEKLREIKYEHKKHIIGFSATPLRKKAKDKLLDIFSSSLDDHSEKKLNLISNYDFFSAIKDNVILPPQYILCEINKTLNGKIGKDNKSIMKEVLTETLKLVPYKKVIGWCRNINQMKEYYRYIKKEFPDLKVFCSSCRDNDMKGIFNIDWYKFSKKKNNCIMLCVNRFREGSDIMNLDTAIYLDFIKKRSLLVALQTSGRVLRKDADNKKTCGMIIDSFVNVNGIKIEVLTAERIIGYYKQILSLCDDNDYESDREKYKQITDICKNMKYDEKKKQITVKYDDMESHDMTISLQLKTKIFDFSKLKMQMTQIIDKLYKIDKNKKFDIIVEKLKEGQWFDNKTKDFWDTYDRKISEDEKAILGLPETAKDLYKEYKEIFDTKSWYQILGIDMSKYYQTVTKCIKVLSDLTDNEITDAEYYKCTKKDKRLPPNPDEFFKLHKFSGISETFNKQTKSKLSVY